MPNVEPYLSDIITYLLPYAASGVLVAACVLAVSRLPLLNIAALAAACACLGAILSTGEGGMDVAMQMTAAGAVSAGILLLSGGALWRRPSLRAMLRRPSPQPQRTTALYPPGSPPGGEGAAQPAPSPSQGEGRDEGGIAQNPLFRLAAAAVIGLAIEALAPRLPLAIGAQEMRLGLWLAGMGLFAGLSSGSVLVSGAGYIMAISAVTLVIPDLVTDVTLRPLVFAAIAALMIIAALGFSFAGVLRRPAKVL